MIYFDNNATTAIAPEVLEAMLPYLKEQYGNPSSPHSFGGRLYHKLEAARENVAALIGAEPEEIIFTSGGTESNNAAIASALESAPDKRQIVTTQVEHTAILNCVRRFMQKGWKGNFLPVRPSGELDLEAFNSALTEDDVAVVSVMLANNETGVIFPVTEIGQRCRERQILFHVDAVQAVGKIPVRVKEMGIDMLSISGHKLHAPKGVGALYVRKGCPFFPFLVGGGQESGLRSGTENVASIVGFGKACEMALHALEEEGVQVAKLRDKLESALIAGFPGAIVNGATVLRLPNTCSISFLNIEGETILRKLDRQGICASGGSACSSGSSSPSHVLSAMAVRADFIKGSVRFSLSRYSTEQEIDEVIAAISGIIS